MSVVFCHKIYNSLKKLNICKNCLKSWFWSWIVVLHWTITVYNIIFFLVKLSLHYWLHSIMFPPRILHLRISPRKRKHIRRYCSIWINGTYGCASWRKKEGKNAWLSQGFADFKTTIWEKSRALWRGSVTRFLTSIFFSLIEPAQANTARSLFFFLS